jgi:outer membrane protein assembly factor BamB
MTVTKQLPTRLVALGGLLAGLALVPVLALRGADAKNQAAEWPQFRGPNRNDISPDKGLLKQWPNDGPKEVWKCEELGIGFSSVSVAGGRIFTMGDLKDGCYLFGIDQKEGKQTWKLKVGKTGGNYQGPRCTPTVDGDLVFALGQFGDLVCVKAATGEEVWRKDFGKDFKGSAGGWNYTESPLVDGDKLVCTPGGKEATMVALNKKNGEVVWKGVIPGGETAGYSSIVTAIVNNVPMYVQLLSNGVAGFGANDGKLLWRYGTDKEHFAGNTANIPTPIVKGDLVFSAAGYGRGAGLFKIKPTRDGFDTEEIYFKKELTNKHGGVVLVGDYLYGDHDDSGHPWCAEFMTGKTTWKNVRPSKGGGSASLTYADDRLYVRYANGFMVLAEPSPEAYKEVSVFKIPNGNDNSWNHPVVIGGKMYLREKDILWCYDVKE